MHVASHYITVPDEENFTIIKPDTLNEKLQALCRAIDAIPEGERALIDPYKFEEKDNFYAMQRGSRGEDNEADE